MKRKHTNNTTSDQWILARYPQRCIVGVYASEELARRSINRRRAAEPGRATGPGPAGDIYDIVRLAPGQSCEA